MADAGASAGGLKASFLPASMRPGNSGVGANVTGEQNTRVPELTTVREELERTRAQLHSIIEDLEVSNQQLKSANALEQAIRRDAEQARTEAEAANRAKDHFLAMVSHELRSPLQGIMGRVEIIRRGVNREQLKQSLAAIDRGVAKQVRLVKDLLDISSVVSGNVRIEHRPMNPVRVAQRAIRAATPAAVAKRQELSADLTESGNVLGDEDRLEQVFSNLLSNAIEFTPEGGAIKVRCASSDGHFAIRIEDNGEGIAPEFIPKIFDRFSQADPSFARRHGGLGLGLAIARTLIELHGGTIEAASPGIDQGTSITVELPLHAGETEGTSDSPSEPADVRELDVLLVEDDADLLAGLAMTFEGASARVRIARSAAQALAVFSEKRPDVLISDIAMPGYDGLYLVREIRKLHGKDTPAVALTGLASGLDRQVIVTAGFDECINKPVSPQKLIELTASLVRRRRRMAG